jgi:hypothetical protein
MRIATVVALLSFSMTLVAADSYVGTWKLNVAKSKLTGNSVDLVSETMTVAMTGPNTFRTTIDAVTKSGQTRHQEINRTLDGKEHPVTGVGVNPAGATEIVEPVDASTRRLTQKRDGKVVSTFTSIVSPDGKTMTTDRHRADGSEEINVFERQ